MSFKLNHADEEAGLKSHFTHLEAARLQRIGAKLAGNPKPAAPPNPPEVVNIAVRRRMPRVLWKTGLWRVDSSWLDLEQEFHAVAYDVGMSRFEADYKYGQYATLLLFEAANILLKTRSVTACTSLDVGEAESEQMGVLADQSIEDDGESSDPRWVNPIQTLADARAVLRKLSEKVRTTAQYVLFDGLSIDDCAALQNITRNAVELRLYRARQQLACALKIPLWLYNRAAIPAAAKANRRTRRPRRRPLC